MQQGLLVLTILILSVGELQANEPPQVSNVRAVQRADTTLVDVTYDLVDADGDTLFVTVAILDSAGVDTVREAFRFVGDIGSGILPGSGKQIVWNVGRDVPNTVRKYVALVTATDGPGGYEIVVTTPAGTQHVMVLVSEGNFQMGSEAGNSDERPVHTVFLNAYYIDKYEVTNDFYQAFVQATGRNQPRFATDNRFNAPQQPVAGVTWFDADSYCRWIKGRLPTEAEWEKAARGTDGRVYPWGNGTPTSELSNYDFNVGQIVAVGSYPTGVSPYGAHDMAGNVWEWCADWYSSGYYNESPSRNPTGPSSGSTRVLRGGSLVSSDLLRSAVRSNHRDPLFSSYDIGGGFRCVVHP
jgi:formylglycine-generating enzyme required for sulfatase activity